MKTVTIDLGDRSYPIFIGTNLLDNSALFLPYINSRRVFIISNEIVAPLYLEQVKKTLGDACDIHQYILPDGEATKTLDFANTLFTKMLEAPCDRLTTVLALGGGVIGDLSGFAAACYQRGIPFIQIPTTLLSQVDSSVGGKTGVNHPLGKNMIGAFYQPQCVVIDTNTLKTLNDRELSAGLAEVIKYGLIRDPLFFDWLENNIDRAMARDTGALAYIIERSCQNKAAVVAEDEREQGVRALLNLGHTFGHAIENAKGYGQWLHGEAVALGMVMAADLSRRLGWIDQTDQDRIVVLLQRAQLPVDHVDGVSVRRLRALMTIDKKVLAGELRLVLLQGIGSSLVSSDTPEALILQTLEAFTRPAA